VALTHTPAFPFTCLSTNKVNIATSIFITNKFDLKMRMGCRMNKLRVLKEKDVGAIGIGAMIVFIAMVLVAGIAASVLIQTSGRLETQAMKSGAETISEVATGIQVDSILGYNISGAVQRLAIEIRPRAGSKEVDLSETVVELSDSSTKNLFTYGNNFTDTGDIDGDIFTVTFYPNVTGVVFGIIVLEDADDSITSPNPIINSGDHVLLTINITAAFGNFGTRVDVNGQVIPEEGSPGVISFTTPAAYNTAVVELQ